MNLTDLLFGNNHHSAKGRMHLLSRSGGPVTLTKGRSTTPSGMVIPESMSLATITGLSITVLPGIPIAPVNQYDQYQLQSSKIKEEAKCLFIR